MATKEASCTNEPDSKETTNRPRREGFVRVLVRIVREIASAARTHCTEDTFVLSSTYVCATMETIVMISD